MNKLVSVATVFSVLIISGCGGDSADFNSDNNDNGDGNTPSTSLNSFNGNWSNGCEYDQLTGTADILSLKINGSQAELNVSTYSNDTCSDAPTESSSTSYQINYPGQLALNNCFNAQKVDTTINFPVTVNGVEFSEEQFNALPALDRADFGIIAAFDLLCVNQNASILYAGEPTSGAGSSDATRPTRANLSFGLNRIQ